MPEFISLDASIDTTNWDRAVDKILADAARLEDVLANLRGMFDDLGGAVSIDVEADTASVDELIGDLEGIEDQAVQVEVEADTEAVDTLIGDLESIADEAVTVDVETDTDAINLLEADLLAIEDEAVAVEVDADTAAVDTLEDQLGDIADEDVAITTTTPDIDARVAEISGKLDTVKNLAIIDFVFNIPENFTTFVNTLQSLPGVSFLIDTDDALAKIEARTGDVGLNFEELGGVINDIYAETSLNKDVIADVLINLIRQGETSTSVLHEMAQAALDFEDATGKSALAAQSTADSMVKAGLADNLTQAYDLLTIAMQGPADKGGDLLSTIERQAGALKELGFTGEEVVALVNSGIQAGLPSASSVVDIIKGMVRTEGGTAAQEAIESLGLADEQAAKDAGEITGGEYVEAVLGAIKEVDSAQARKELVSAIFGGRAVAAGAENILSLTIEPDFETAGAAARAAEAIDRSMGAAFQRAATTLETAVVTALDNALDISGFLQKIEDAANTFATKMQEGATIGQALEIALDIPEGTIGRIESAFGNLALALLEIAANIGEFLGKDVSGLRRTVAEGAATQFAFDIQLAETEEDVKNAIQAAIDRGVEASTIQEGLGTAVTEMLQGGDIEGATALVENANSLFNPELVDTLITKYGTLEEAQRKAAVAPTTIGLFGAKGGVEQFTEETGATPEEALRVLGLPQEIDPAVLDEQVSAYKAQIDDAFDRAISSGDVGEAQRLGQILGLTSSEVNEFMAEFGPSMEGFATAAVAPIDTIVTTALEQFQETMDTTATRTDTATGKMSGSMIDLQKQADTSLPKAEANFEALGTAVGTFVLANSGRLEEFVNILKLFDEVGVAAINTAKNWDETTGGGGGGNANPTNAPETGLQHGGMGHGAFWTGETGRELVFSDPRVAVLGHQSSEALASAVRALMPTPAGAGGGRSITVNVYNNFQTQSLAQDGAALQRMANSIRGYY